MEKITEIGINITDCRFKYHQLLSGIAQYHILDNNRNLTNTISTSIEKIDGEIDLYQFVSVTVTSYKETGSYIQCYLLDSNAMMDGPVSSGLSNETVFDRKFLNVFMKL